jgi:hypothetical protein
VGCRLCFDHQFKRFPPLVSVPAYQFGGVDALYYNPTGTCSTLDLTPGAGNGSGAWVDVPSCTYLATFGPFYVWGAATVSLPARRQALFFGGRETAPDGSRNTRFAVPDSHWALDLDALTWTNLAPDPFFWGLPQLSGTVLRGGRS